MHKALGLNSVSFKLFEGPIVNSYELIIFQISHTLALKTDLQAPKRRFSKNGLYPRNKCAKFHLNLKHFLNFEVSRLPQSYLAKLAHFGCKNSSHQRPKKFNFSKNKKHQQKSKDQVWKNLSKIWPIFKSTALPKVF